MDKHDIDFLKAGHNILDVVERYVPLKKNGKNYVGLCPFHGEKTPSFTVDEKKQMFYCFGCGAGGDVIKFIMDYSGYDFREALKELGGDIEFKTSEQVLDNVRAAEKIRRWRVPEDNKEDGDLANKYMSKCHCESVGGVDFFKYKGGYMLPIYNADFELVNAVNFRHGEAMSFIAGGRTYGGFTPVRINDSSKWIACVSLSDGRYIAHEKQINVAVCWDAHSLNYLCKWNHADLKVWPALRESDDDWAAYQMDWVKIKEDMTLEKIKCLN